MLFVLLLDSFPHCLQLCQVRIDVYAHALYESESLHCFVRKKSNCLLLRMGQRLFSSRIQFLKAFSCDSFMI